MFVRFLVLLFFLNINSCSVKKVDPINTEIFCPDGSRLLIKNVRAKDLEDAALSTYNLKKARGTADTNTAFRLRDGRHFVVERIPPEKMVACVFQESYRGFAEKSYVR